MMPACRYACQYTGLRCVWAKINMVADMVFRVAATGLVGLASPLTHYVKKTANMR